MGAKPMDTNYHYHTIKTLAIHAGFDGLDAQYISHFSGQVDDFIMHAPFVLDAEPPAFFTENNLARKLRIRANRWVFMPCTTGISLLRMVSGGYRLQTLVPFHFIMPRPYQELHRNAERSLYRCVSANRGRVLLVNRLMEEKINQFPQKYSKKAISEDEYRYALLNLGMLLHIFADTYAHEGYSGLQGWENASYVHEGMHPREALLYRALPSIGHANAGGLPDDCGAVFDIYAKRSEKSPFESFIKRDNGVFFADCSRRILDMLCGINEKTPSNDREWGELQTKLFQAQTNTAKENTDTLWAQTFPHITYAYNKHEFMQIKMEVLHKNTDILEKLQLNADDLCDIYGEEADRGRLSAITLAGQVNGDFFRYNEAAYRHVRAVTGDFATHSHRTQLEAYCAAAEREL
jgi:hypothetical protein